MSRTDEEEAGGGSGAGHGRGLPVTAASGRRGPAEHGVQARASQECPGSGSPGSSGRGPELRASAGSGCGHQDRGLRPGPSWQEQIWKVGTHGRGWHCELGAGALAVRTWRGQAVRGG